MKSKFFIISFMLLMILTLFGCVAKQIGKVLGPPPTRPTHFPTAEGQVAQAYINIARGWLSLKNYPYAIEAYKELVVELPMERFVVADSLFQIGKIYQESGDYEKAIEAYDNLFKKDPESERRDEAIYRQAVCFETIHEFTEAYEWYKIYIKLGEDKEFCRQAREKVEQMEFDGDGDGYPFYKEQEAGTSDEDANSYPMSFPLISPGPQPN
ncbi:tetratricopeptide repeat protein [Candidatus Poribacteria bacterium]|nr:tetratricopeptide repeat protein [Candidatus Poribacteria bacterium]